MSEIPHTPGPWVPVFHGEMAGVKMYWLNQNTSIGSAVPGDVILAGAAPELLEALANAVSALESWNISPIGGLAHMREVLAKATGTTQ